MLAKFGAAMMAAVFLVSSACAEPPPIEAFARMPAMRSVAISPNGSMLAYIYSRGEQVTLVAAQRSNLAEVKLLMSAPKGFALTWCNWANDTRLLCGFTGMMVESGQVYPVTRLAAIDADGSNLKVLIQHSSRDGGQLQDRILDWTPDEPDTVLVQLDEDYDGFPNVYELNVNTGTRATRVQEHKPIRWFSTDAKGNIRLGRGYYDGRTDIYYFARLENDKAWRQLAKIKANSATDALQPIAVAVGNKAFASGSFEGREALYEMDLADQSEPQLVFSHPLVDAAAPMLTPDGRLLGIHYELDRPFTYYTDEKIGAWMASVNKALPSTFNAIRDYTRDEKAFVIKSYSDTDGGAYHLLDVDARKMLLLGRAYPELDPAQIAHMRSIEYPAADGVSIPGYLTVPLGVRAEKLPLIVMPHGGPVARDSWDFDFLRAFLVSRGYAVLQMNFRGSSGYGSKWLMDAHQDWGGLTYADIADGTRWAVKQGIADPQRVCIVGWSFGGYAALLGAVRNSDLYKCAVSVAGVSDLPRLVAESRFFVNYKFAQEEIGTDREKLRNDSPLRHAQEVEIPVLLLHGNRDYQVDVDHTKKMAAALKRAKKNHRAVLIEGATHQLDRQADRITLLTEVEKFLMQNLGQGAVAQ